MNKEEFNKTMVNEERVYTCGWCNEKVYACASCDEYLISDISIHPIYCDNSNPTIRHYCQSCGEDMLTQEDQGNIDGGGC